MDKLSLQKFFIRKLMNFRPPKWGDSHTEETNLFKGLPKHMRGKREVHRALDELYASAMVIRHKKTSETHVSLNPRMKKEIEEIVGIGM